VRFAFVSAEKANYPILILCRVLNVSRSGYYAWSRRRPSARQQADARLDIEIRISHQRSGRTYGSPRVYQDLLAKGIRVGRKRVERLMRQQGLKPKRPRNFRNTTDSSHALPVAPNLLDRKFKVDRPNSVWAGDITYVWTAAGWLYLAVLLDLYSRRVVGWAVRETLDSPIALEALDKALASRRPDPGLVHHTDRGSQYCSHAYQSRLKESGCRPSMSRVGNCWDNAVSESFFASMKREIEDFESFDTREEAITAIADYIDNFYNPRRRHSSAAYLSPLEFELRSKAALAAA
jgi:putative transposase